MLYIFDLFACLAVAVISEQTPFCMLIVAAPLHAACNGSLAHPSRVGEYIVESCLVLPLPESTSWVG